MGLITALSPSSSICITRMRVVRGGAEIFPFRRALERAAEDQNGIGVLQQGMEFHRYTFKGRPGVLQPAPGSGDGRIESKVIGLYPLAGLGSR